MFCAIPFPRLWIFTFIKFTPTLLLSNWTPILGRILSRFSSSNCFIWASLRYHVSFAKMNVRIAIATVAIADNQEDIESAVKDALPCRWFPTTSPRMNNNGATTAIAVTINGIRLFSFILSCRILIPSSYRVDFIWYRMTPSKRSWSAKLEPHTSNHQFKIRPLFIHIYGASRIQLRSAIPD